MSMSCFCCTSRGCFCRKEEPPKILYVFDFDCTIVVRNSESVYRTAVARHLGVAEGAVEDPPTPIRWDHICQALIDYVTGPCGVSMQELLDAVKEIPFVQGMDEVLQKLGSRILDQNPNARFIILSGANDLFIQTKLSGAFLPRPDAIISNHGSLLDDKSSFRYATHSNQSHCKLCNRALCKGTELEFYFESHGRFLNIHFICDGTNDICPAMRLRQEDTVYVRSGYGLDAMIQRGIVAGLPILIKAKIVYWTNGEDLKGKLIENGQDEAQAA